MNKKMFSISLATSLLTAGLLLSGCTQSSVNTAEVTTKQVVKKELTLIKMDEAEKLYNAKNTLFLDARPFKLYQRGTIMGSLDFPAKRFNELKNLLPVDKSASIVTFCNGYQCEKSDVVAKKLQAIGYTNVKVYKGGFPEWQENKKPLMGTLKERKPKVITSTYKPPLAAIDVNGVNIHLLPEDGEANEDGIIDQFWLAEQISNCTLSKNIHIVDVRKTEKYNTEHIDGAINVPFDKKTETLDTSKFPEDGIIVLHCNTGLMSTDARNTLDDDLLERVFIFDITYKCDKENKNCKVNPNEAL